jgi:hypothetical protein
VRSSRRAKRAAELAVTADAARALIGMRQVSYAYSGRHPYSVRVLVSTPEEKLPKPKPKRR